MSLFHELKRRNVIRVVAAYAAISWLVVQVTETVFPVFGLGDNVVRGVIIVLAIGLVPALVFSWVFELTPEGVKRDRDLDRTTHDPAKMQKRLDRAILVTLVIAVAYFAIDKFVIDPSRDASMQEQAIQLGRSKALIESYGDRSIAVLPFVNLSSDPEQEYFSVGIAEELLNLLVRVPELRVISRSSAFRFKGADLDIPHIAEQLRVKYVLEGSVRRAGNQVRVAAQLIDARSDMPVWSETFDRELGSIFEIQDDIAADVVRNIRGQLTSNLPALRRTVPEAYELTLRARFLDRSGRVPKGGLSILDMLERAVELDPDYQPALLALASKIYFSMQQGAYAPDLGIQRIEELLGRASSIDPENPVLIGYLAWISFEGRQDFEAAASQFESAIRLTPGDAELLAVAGAFASATGKHDIAVELKKRAAARDPLCFTCLYDLARTYEDAGRYDEALTSQNQYMQLGEGGGGTLGMLHLYRGEPELALASFEGERTNDFQANAGRAMALKDLGRDAESADALRNQIRLFGDEFPLETARPYAWIGDRDAAFEWLDKAIGETPFEFVILAHDPIWQKLRDDPRWRAWQERTGMTEERLEAIEFDPQLTD